MQRLPRPPSRSTNMAYSPSSSPAESTSPSAFKQPQSNESAERLKKSQRRTSSFEILQGLAGPESLLPLPKRESLQINSSPRPDGIREGLPTDFASDSLGASSSKRPPSPTRTLSRKQLFSALDNLTPPSDMLPIGIPVASVGGSQ